MPYDIFLEHINELLAGLGITLILLFSALLVGGTGAALLLLGSFSRYKVVRYSISGWVTIVQGTPQLVQLFLLYYGTGSLLAHVHWPTFAYLASPLGCAIASLGLNSAAYTYSFLRKALLALPKGPIEAAQALGMSPKMVWWKIKWPLLQRAASQAYTNEWVFVLKGTALAGTITLMDFMGVVQMLLSTTYAIQPLWLLAAAVYLLLHTLILFFCKSIKKAMKWKAFAS